MKWYFSKNPTKIKSEPDQTTLLDTIVSLQHLPRVAAPRVDAARARRGEEEKSNNTPGAPSAAVRLEHVIDSHDQVVVFVVVAAVGDRRRRIRQVPPGKKSPPCMRASPCHARPAPPGHGLMPRILCQQSCWQCSA